MPDWTDGCPIRFSRCRTCGIKHIIACSANIAELFRFVNSLLTNTGDLRIFARQCKKAPAPQVMRRGDERIFSSISAPESRTCKDNERVYLQPAEQHHDRENDLGECREYCEVARRADDGEAGADIRHGRERGGEVHGEVVAVYGDQKSCHDDYEDIQEEEAVDRLCRRSVHALAVHLHAAHLARVQHLNDVRPGSLYKQHDAAELEAAAGAARAAADEHERCRSHRTFCLCRRLC